VPRVKMTPVTRWALFVLRIYLIVLLGLLVVRFTQLAH
jgi:hypothetical protein